MKDKRTPWFIAQLVCMLACVVFAVVQVVTYTTSAEAGVMSQSEGARCEVIYPGLVSDLDGHFLKEGDSVAVISPSALPTQKQVDDTVRGLKQWGYVPVLGSHVCEEGRTLDDCLEDLKWALEEPSIKAVFCVRGGYGASEVMDALPADLVASANKLIIGYSDITVFQSAWTKAQIPSIHASMSAAFSELPETCAEAERRMLRGEIPAYTCESSNLCKQGEADGILIGGNLSTFTSLLGTAYDCTQTDQPYLLFLEDVGEDVQHVHRYLTVLKHMGVLDRASGIIFGEWVDVPTDLGDYLGDSRGGSFASIEDMISRQIVNDLNVPVAFGFPAGHGETNNPLLMGAQAHLSVSAESFTLEWEKR